MKSLLPVVQYKKYTGEIYASSVDVADYFGKMHKNVLRDINQISIDMPDLAAQFRAAKYKNRGKIYDCFNMTKDGFVFLVMGFTGDKAAELKYAYINRFNEMDSFIKNRIETKTGHIKMCKTLHDVRESIGKETKFHTYCYETDNIYRIVTGMSAKQLKENLSIPDNRTVCDYLTPGQLEAIAALREFNSNLIAMGEDYKTRKEKLQSLYDCRFKPLLVA